MTAAFAFRKAPSERSVLLRLGRADSIQQVELTWIDAEGDALSSSRWSFDRGAPAVLRTRLRARDGRYRAAITVKRRGDAVQAGDAQAQEVQADERRVTFAGDAQTEIVLP